MSPIFETTDERVEFVRQTARGKMRLQANLTNIDKILQGRHRRRIWAIATFQTPDEKGFPSEIEQMALQESEKDLLARLPDDGSILYVGSITHGGKYVVVLYSQYTDSVGPGTAFQMQTGSYIWDVYDQDDESAEFLRTKLQPTSLELRRIKDQEIMNVLNEAGDDPSIPRPITLYGLFQTRSQAEAASYQLREIGFRTHPPSELPGNGEMNWSLMFQKTASTDRESIEEFSSAAEEIVTATGGTYDGWECMPVS